MDVNDINAKLARLHSALNNRMDPEFERHAKIEEVNEGFKLTIPAVDDLPKLENVVRSIIDNLATFKDAFKNKLQQKGEDKPIVKEFIESSTYLKILIDLDNAHKHGYPTKSNISQRNPRIKNVKQTLRLKFNEGQLPFGLLSTKGDLEIKDASTSEVVVIADVYDGNDNFLLSLDDLIEECYDAWLSFAEQHELFDTE